jgi:adenylate kinase family enzyme
LFFTKKWIVRNKGKTNNKSKKVKPMVMIDNRGSVQTSEQKPETSPKQGQSTNNCNQLARDGALCIIAPPMSGGTTLMRIMRAASCYLGGYVFCGAKEVIAWNKDPANDSPFREGLIQKEQKPHGGFLDDLLVCQGLEQYLQAEAKKSGTIRRLVLEGIPRNRNQYETLTRVFPGMKSLIIDLPFEKAEAGRQKRIKAGKVFPGDEEKSFYGSWNLYREKTQPFIKELVWEGHDQVKTIQFSASPNMKALKLLRHMGPPAPEYTSLMKQIINPQGKAFKMIKENEPYFRAFSA